MAAFEENMSREPFRKVAFFSHAATFGGAEKDLFELVMDLMAQPGWEVLVVVPGQGEQAQRLVESGVRVVVGSLPWMREVSSDGTFLNADDGMNRLERGWIELVACALPSLEEFRPDLIVSQTCTIPWGCFSAALLGIPHVWNLREYGELDHSLFPMLAGVVDDSAISQSADLIFTCSDEVGRDWEARLGRPYRVLYSIPRLSPRAAAHKGAECETPSFKVVHVGTLGAAKRPELLLEAIKYVVDQDVDVRVQFVGDGPQRIELEDRARILGLDSRIEFLGWQNDVGAIVAQADVAVSCSSNEAQGRTLPEAASLGVVPVFPRTRNWAEKFTSGVDSLSYELGDARSLANSLLELTDEVRRTELSTRAKALAERDFDHRPPAKVFEEAVESLLDGDRTSQNSARVTQGVILQVLRKHIVLNTALEAHSATEARRASEFADQANRETSAAKLERDQMMVGFRTLDRECALLRTELVEVRAALEHIESSKAWRLRQAIRRVLP